MEKVDISSLPLPQLTEWVTGTLGEPKFRAGQIYRWIHQKRVGSFAEMTNLHRPAAKAGGACFSHGAYHPAAAGKQAG